MDISRTEGFNYGSAFKKRLKTPFWHEQSRTAYTYQTCTRSLFICFWGERRLGVRLGRARSHEGTSLFFLLTFSSIEFSPPGFTATGIFS